MSRIALSRRAFLAGAAAVATGAGLPVVKIVPPALLTLAKIKELQAAAMEAAIYGQCFVVVAHPQNDHIVSRDCTILESRIVPLENVYFIKA